MKTTTLIFFLFAVLGVAQAQEEKKIYKYTDENGVTHYTETKPNEAYEEADLPPLSVVPSTPVTNNTSYESGSDNQEVELAQVNSFTIIEPVNEQNLWGTGGKLTAKVEKLTEAQARKYQIQFVIDGKKNKPADASTQTFPNIYRGEHKVQALLIDRQTQQVAKRSQTVTFFMHQNSKK
ncbi:MAG: DUF4124 domain-containing protein [Marinicella sp.]